MITRLKLKPGQKGTKQMVEKYGEALVCVRYRYNAAGSIRIKTVELVEEKKEIKSPRQNIADDMVVPVRIAYGERQLGKVARGAGGRWDPDVRLWYVQYGKIKGTELERHIILDADAKGSRK